MPPSNELSSLEKKLESLKTQVEEVSNAAKSRQRRATIVIGIFIIIMAIYLSFAYNMIANQNASTYVSLALAPLKPQISKGAENLAESLKSQAPMYINQAGNAVLAIPPQLSTIARNYISDQIQTNAASIEKQLIDASDASLTTAEANLRDKGIDPKNPADYDKATSLIAQTFHDESQKAIRNFYQGYTNQADLILDHINTLAEGNKLDKRQQIQRDLITLFLVVLKRTDVGGGTPEPSDVATTRPSK